MGLPDLMNFLKNKRTFPHITPDNAPDHYLFANGCTLNGIYLHQYLLGEGYDPIVVQNYSLVNLPDILEERPLAVCISSTFLYLDDIKEMAQQIKRFDPTVPVILGGILVKKVMNAGESLAPQTLNWLSSFLGHVDAFVVETHGEQTLLKVLETLGNGGDVSRIPNLALFDEEGKVFFTPREEEDFHMDSTAIAWDKRLSYGQHGHRVGQDSTALPAKDPLGDHQSGMPLQVPFLYLSPLVPESSLQVSGSP
jgi:hypothetical protein